MFKTRIPVKKKRPAFSRNLAIDDKDQGPAAFFLSRILVPSVLTAHHPCRHWLPDSLESIYFEN